MMWNFMGFSPLSLTVTDYGIVSSLKIRLPCGEAEFLQSTLTESPSVPEPVGVAALPQRLTCRLTK